MRVLAIVDVVFTIIMDSNNSCIMEADEVSAYNIVMVSVPV